MLQKWVVTFWTPCIMCHVVVCFNKIMKYRVEMKEFIENRLEPT